MPERITQHLGFNAGGASRSLANLTKRLDAANASLRSFKGTSGQVKGVNSLGKNTKKASKNVGEFTASWQTLSRVFATQILVRGMNVFTTALKEGVDRAAEYGLAIQEIQTISGRGIGTEKLTDDIIRLSDTLAKAPQDLAEAYYQTLSNQVVETGEAFKFTADAAKLATITASETKDAVNALSSVMNSYNLSAEQSTHISNTLFKTVEFGRLRLSEIADVIGRVTPLTAQMGVSWEETAASIAVMTRQGVRSHTAITQLRAVMTKLIKPTDELREIFHSWGVEDGRQAIETFGGLRGVLKKLANETGGSSAEMAQLFRRVRAIVGQMSIMQDDGKLVAETMDKIKNSTSAVNKEFEIFAASDAFKYKQSVQQLNNEVTRLGKNLLPSVRIGLLGVNTIVEAGAEGFGRMTGRINAATDAVDRLTKNQQTHQKTVDMLNERFAKWQREGYQNLTEAANRYYAEIGKEENRLANIRDRAIKRSTAVVTGAGDDVVSFYKDSIKELERFINDANSKILSAAKKIANIQQTINERQLESRLSKTESAQRKLAIIEREAAKKRAKIRAATGAVDATEESAERALDLLDQQIDLREKQKRIAEEAGKDRSAEQLEKRIIDLLKDKQEVLKANATAVAEAVPAVKKEYEIRKEEEKRLKALIEERNQLFKSGQLGSDNKQLRKNAEATLKEIDSNITKLLGRAANGGAFLRSLGLDKNFGIITDGLTSALNKATKDWNAEVARARAAFSRELIPLKIAIDTTGVVENAAQQLGISQTESEKLSQFNKRVGEASIDLLKERNTIQNDVNNKQKQANFQLEETLKNSKLINEGYAQNTRAALERFTINARNNALLASDLEIQKMGSRALLKYRGHAVNVKNTFDSMVNTLKQGGTVTDENVQKLIRMAGQAEALNQITSEQADLYRITAKLIGDTSTEQKKANDAASQLPEKEKIRAAEAVADALRNQKEQQKGGADAASRAQENIQRAREAARSFRDTTKQGGDRMNQVSQSAARADTNTKQMATNASRAVGAIQTLVTKWNEVALAASKAAKAQAGASSGGVATARFGGKTSYFANGGRARGSDRVPAMLSRGEMVINSRSSKKFFSELNAMNQGSKPIYREQGGPVTNVGDVNVTVKGGDSSQQTVREIGNSLRREIRRGNIKLH